MPGEAFENHEKDRDEEIESGLVNLAGKVKAKEEAIDDLTQAILTGTAAELERRGPRDTKKKLANVRTNDPHLTFSVGSTKFEIKCWYESGKRYPTIQLLKPPGLRAYDAGTELGRFKDAVVKKIAAAN